ncbi:hypothetical protein M3231_22935 [Neobacillus mesonae]|nr:hypothetical protein [Neobacillus mesonae]
MYVIQNAKITNKMELNGVSCVEVAVEPGQAGDPSLLVYVSQSASGSGLDLHRVVRNHHDLALDWYNDNHNAAFQDATEVAFENSQLVTAEQEKGQFIQSLLNFGTLNQDILSKFQR